jgi:hypothetical protein
MANEVNIPDGYEQWAQQYFGEAIAAVLDEMAVGVGVEESLQTARDQENQQLNAALDTSKREADEANLAEALRQSVEQKKADDKDRIEANKKAMQPAVEAAKTITPLTPKFAQLIDTFTKAQRAFAIAEQEDNDEKALQEQESLKKAAEALANVKSEHDAEAGAWAAIEGWQKTDGVKVKEVLAQASLPAALQQPQRELASAYSTFNAAVERSEYVEAQGLLRAVGEKMTAFQQAQAKQEQLKVEVEKQYANLKGLSKALTLKDLHGDPAPLHGELVQADKAYQAEFIKAEYESAKSLLQPLSEALKKFQTVKEEQDNDKQTVEQNNQDMTAAMDAAKTMTPITPKFAELVKIFTEARNVYDAAEKVKNYKDMIKAQKPLKEAADALAAGKDEHDNEVKAWATIEGWKKTNDATLQEVAAYAQATPEARAQLRQLRPLKLQFDNQVDAQAYVAAVAFLPKLEQVVTTLHGLKGDYDKAMVERQKVDLARKALKDRYDEANGLSALTENLMKLKKNLAQAENTFDEFYNGGDYTKALAQVKNVEAAVKAVLGVRAEYNAAELLADKAKAKLKQSTDKWKEAKGVVPTLPEVRPLQQAMVSLWKECQTAMNARKYNEAFNKAEELWTKVDALLKLKDAADLKQAALQNVNGLYNSLNADVQKAKKLKALTPELQAAEKNLDEAGVKFQEAYKAFDFEEAARRFPALEEAVKRRHCHDDLRGQLLGPEDGNRDAHRPDQLRSGWSVDVRLGPTEP